MAIKDMCRISAGSAVILHFGNRPNETRLYGLVAVTPRHCAYFVRRLETIFSIFRFHSYCETTNHRNEKISYKIRYRAYLNKEFKFYILNRGGHAD